MSQVLGQLSEEHVFKCSEVVSHHQNFLLKPFLFRKNVFSHLTFKVKEIHITNLKINVSFQFERLVIFLFKT